MDREDKLFMTRLALIGCTGLTALTTFACGAFLLVVIVVSRAAAPTGSETRIAEVPSATPTLAVEATLPPAAQPNPTATPQPAQPTPTAVVTIPSSYTFVVPSDIDQRPIPVSSSDTLEQLLTTEYPVRDYYDTAFRLARGFSKVGERTVTAPDYQFGDSQEIFTDRGSTEMVLRVTTDNAYFWVERGVQLDQTTLVEVARRFDDEIYPAVSGYFGQEWRPGVDNNPRISIMHLAEFEGNELGYFDPSDVYPRSLYRASNQQEALYLNMSELRLGSDLYYGTLAHELEHLIQWFNDGNETTWLDEGLAQLAEQVAGFDTFVVDDYLIDTNLQLNGWSHDEDVYGHYSAAALFLIYCREQLGDAAVQELARHPANGLASVDAILRKYRPELSLEQFLGNWFVANYLGNNGSQPEHTYAFGFYPAEASTVLNGRDYPHQLMESVAQNGVVYIDFEGGEEITISFAGDTLIDLVRPSPRIGDYVWFSPGTDNLNAQLTRPVDLRSVDSATLRFDAWYDLEMDYDFAYIMVSDDDGESWDILDPQNGVSGEFGAGLSGRSTDYDDDALQDGWLSEELSLDAYAGSQILLRFEILTDTGLFGAGFALDNVAIPEANLFFDTESGREGWDAAGFVRSGPTLRQTWSVQWIAKDDVTTVTPLVLDGRNRGQIDVLVPDDGGTLVIAPISPFSNRNGRFWLKVE